MHRNSLTLFKKYLLPRIEPGKTLLEVGGITTHYRDAVQVSEEHQEGEEHNSTTWLTCDRTLQESTSTVIGMDGDYSINSADSMFHYVLAGQVIEHVKKPWLWFSELARVCRHGGLVFLISPISWGYHKAPVDCWRIWPEGMRALLDEAGLVEELIVAEAAGDDSPREQRCQINPGAVLDLVTIARKPAIGWEGVAEAEETEEATA